jgi:carbamoyl-phosphate synthase small subunit
MRGVISTVDLSPESLIEKARGASGLLGQGLVKKVTTAQAYELGEAARFRVTALDFGAKTSILDLLQESGCRVRVLPAHAGVDDILRDDPDGVFLSNGPGDPGEVDYAVDTIKQILGRKPVFGICLGHQLMSLALGARTYKLKFGHRGGNQPVKNLKTGRVEITSQNHGYAVDPDTLPASVEITHINLNDMTNEGISCRDIPAFSVQYHPEASPGPHDSRYLFKSFIELMAGGDG